MATPEERPEVTGTEHVEEILRMFTGNDLFMRGLSHGVESETWPSRPARQSFDKDSPIALLAALPSWEGSYRFRRDEQNLAFSLGAVVGAFATRAGVDVFELTERLAPVVNK